MRVVPLAPGLDLPALGLPHLRGALWVGLVHGVRQVPRRGVGDARLRLRLPLEGAARSLALAYKDARERRLAPVIAATVACALDEAASWPAADGAARFDASAVDAVCFVPATRMAYRRRGFDHMLDVARSLSGMLGLPLADVLARPHARDQRKLGREDRLANASSSMRVVGDVTGCSLLLVDDVVTTGASVRAAARALLEAGASDVTAAALARTW